MFGLKIFVRVQTFQRVPPCSRATSATLTQALCRKEIILVWVSALATWILQTGRVLFFLHLRLFYFLFLVCTVHFASSWLSMVSIDLGSSLYAGRDHPDFGLVIGNLNFTNRSYFYFFLHLRLFHFLFLV